MLTAVNSAPRIPFVSIPLSNAPVPTIDQIYRDNLKLLVAEAPSLKAFAEKVEKSPSQISQWLNASKDSKTGKPRVVSRASARELERKCGKPEGWMDTHHGHAEAAPPEKPTGAVFSALDDDDEQRLLDNYRGLLDSERAELAEDVARRAAKTRAIRTEVLKRFGVTLKEGSTSADAKLTQRARAELEITERLRQESLFDDPSKPEE